jgi:hypothetical protein
MEVTYEDSIIIKRPILDVFSYLEDVTLLCEWVPFYQSIIDVERDDAGLASRFTVVGQLPPLPPVPVKSRIVGYRKGRSIAYRTEVPFLTATYRLEPALGGTLVIASQTVWSPLLLLPLDVLRPTATMLLRRMLEALKTRVEGTYREPTPVAFLSYRREENEYVSGRVYDVLTAEFGVGAIFKDVETLESGNFEDSIHKRLTKSEVFLLLISQTWIDGLEKRRREGKVDHARAEAEQAMRLHPRRIIPLILTGVVVPELEAPLSELHRVQQYTLQPEYFDRDMARVVDTIWAVLEERPPRDRTGTT